WRYADAVRRAVLPRCDAGAEIGRSLFLGGARSRRGSRPPRLYAYPHGRALLSLLRRLQPQPDRLSRRGGTAHPAGPAGDRRGIAGLQPPAEAPRRNRDARPDQPWPPRCRLRARLPAARVPPLRPLARRVGGAVPRRDRTGRTPA